ncbi:MAG: chromosome segregation protein SMC, partial [Acutalibacteraceae bacterium]
RAISELKRLDELKNNTQNSIFELEREEAENRARLENLKKQSDEALSTLAQLDQKRTLLQSEIDAMTGGRDSLNEKREELSAKITEYKLNIIEIQKDIESINQAKENLNNLISSREKRFAEIELEIKALEEQNQSFRNEISNLNTRISALKQNIEAGEQNISAMLAKRNETEKAGVELRASEKDKTLIREKINGELARLHERKEVMLKEYDEVIRRLFDEYQLTRSEAEGLGIVIEKPSEAKKTLADVKNKIRALGNVNVAAIEEYKEVKERFEFLSEQVEDVEKSRAELRKLINQLTTQMCEIFTEAFAKINQNFSKTFSELFGEGQANLSLTDPDNILESGIDINVKLPGKNVPSLDSLSGGEKALIALSIYFSIMNVNPPPFCFFDEVDTALDDINVQRFAEYMKKCGFPTQFICVTHRRGTMEAADMLYGVTMQEKGITKLLELNVAELEKKLLKSNQTA